MNIPVGILVGLVVLLLGSVAAGAIFFGLWMGERGRRLDAQRREGVIRVDEPEEAEVIPPGGGNSEGMMRELSEAPEQWILETMAEADCSREAAEEEWRRLVAQSFGESRSGWTTELP